MPSERTGSDNPVSVPRSAKNAAPIALVTGASRGIGRGIALNLAREGFSVAINYAGNRVAAEETQKECMHLAQVHSRGTDLSSRGTDLSSRGTDLSSPHSPGTDLSSFSSSPLPQFAIFQADMGKRADRDRLVEEVFAHFGRLDALVNNAGIGPRERLDICEATEESFEEVIQVNLQGPYFLTQSVVARWRAQGAGESLLPAGYKVVFVSSISAHTVSFNRGEYCVSKAGMAMAAQLWAGRLADEGIQVFEVRPGIMKTDMTSKVRDKYDRLIDEGLVPQRRWGTPDDMGRPVRALLRGDFPFSTGAVIDVDGGFKISRL